MSDSSDAVLLAILTAINAARAEFAEQLRHNNDRLNGVEDTLQGTIAKLDNHIKDEEDELKGITSMLSEHISASNAWRTKADVEMAENTAVTKDVKSGQTFVRIAKTIVVSAGAVFFALGSIWWGIRTILGGSDITPGP